MLSTNRQRGEISLSYLFKMGFGAFLTLCANSVWDFVSGSLYVHKVQVMATSPQVKHVKECVYEGLMAGHYGGFQKCSAESVYRYVSTPVKVGSAGEIHLEEVIDDARVNLTLTPVFRLGDIEWECRGSPARLMPPICKAEATDPGP